MWEGKKQEVWYSIATVYLTSVFSDYRFDSKYNPTHYENQDAIGLYTS